MKTRIERIVLTVAMSVLSSSAFAQYNTDASVSTTNADTSAVVITLDDALKIALSENVAVKVADKEIERSEYAKKGTYSSLFPQINGSGSYQRTIKKQIMYMDSDSGDGEEGGGFGMLSSLAPYFMRINELSVLQGILDPEKENQELAQAIERCRQYENGGSPLPSLLKKYGIGVVNLSSNGWHRVNYQNIHAEALYVELDEDNHLQVMLQPEPYGDDFDNPFDATEAGFGELSDFIKEALNRARNTQRVK